MKEVKVPLPELGLLAATRGMIGAGAAFLLAGKLSNEKRKAIGVPLLLLGAASTIPIAMHLYKKNLR